jgi:nucleoid-associated protein EbfC
MKDILGMMGRVKEMQAKMQEMQDSLGELEIAGQSGGGMVTVTLTGKGQMKTVAIDPSLLKPEEADIVEDLVVAAHNDAKSRLDDAIAEKTRELTAGLPIPPGFKLPF